MATPSILSSQRHTSSCSFLPPGSWGVSKARPLPTTDCRGAKCFGCSSCKAEGRGLVAGSHSLDTTHAHHHRSGGDVDKNEGCSATRRSWTASSWEHVATRNGCTVVDAARRRHIRSGALVGPTADHH